MLPDTLVLCLACSSERCYKQQASSCSLSSTSITLLLFVHFINYIYLYFNHLAHVLILSLSRLWVQCRGQGHFGEDAWLLVEPFSVAGSQTWLSEDKLVCFCTHRGTQRPSLRPRTCPLLICEWRSLLLWLFVKSSVFGTLCFSPSSTCAQLYSSLWGNKSLPAVHWESVS